MLKEIICDKFIQYRVVLNEGLNIVLGDVNASNSIGKSSFLMVVDFIYGGETYSKSKDIIDNVGHHEIKFCFEFDNEKYYFFRKTDDSNVVHICNNSYESLCHVNLHEYTRRLSALYAINLSSISFRELVSTYSRVYGKGNLNEEYPLESYKGDTQKTGVNRLVKIFDYYDSIKDLEKASTQATDKYKAFTNAVKYNIIPRTVRKSDYSENLKSLQLLRNEEEQYLSIIGSNSADLNTENIELLTSLRKELSSKRRIRNKLVAKLDLLSSSHLGNVEHISQEEVSALLNFFPNTNIRSLEEINIFHKEITKFVDSEISEQKKEVYNNLAGIDNDIEEIIQSINGICGDNSPSIAALNNLTRVRQKIENITVINKFYDTRHIFEDEKKEALINLNNRKSMVVSEIANRLNYVMNEVNDFIYSAKKQSPQIILTEKSYTFRTINDTGTGTAYKNLIIFDLSILKLTQLPFLIHDSKLYNDVSYDCRNKIIECYLDSCKQIFIAIDDKSNYSTQIQSKIEQCKIIQLGSNENSLFGKSWTNKVNN